MAYPQLRSMNDSLTEGATDGRVKKIRPDSEGSQDAEVTYLTRRNLSLPYYGIGEQRVVFVPGTNGPTMKPDFHPNKFETEEDGPTFGKTW